MEQKLIAKEQKQKYRNTTSHIANSLDVSKKKLQSFRGVQANADSNYGKGGQRSGDNSPE